MKAIALYITLAVALFACKGETEMQRNSVVASSGSLFTPIPSSKSGVKFSNTLSDSEYFNIIKYDGYYNGAGVALGDINNDGLTDIYFVSNQWQNVLYLNKGDFEFKDITVKAGVAGTGNWKTGVTMADVNGDGFLDIFVCTAGTYGDFKGRTQLYINNGDLTFTERAEELGVAYEGAAIQSTFLDWDKDGDLDLSLLSGDGGLIFINEQADGKTHFGSPMPTGSLIDQHNSGRDVGDVNEDGLYDIVRAGEFPDDDRMRRLISPGLPNSLSLRVRDPEGRILFTDIAAFAGVAATAISWAPLFADFDLDGKKDLFITTGTPRRKNDLTYLKNRDSLSTEEKIAAMPPASLPNRLFRNKDYLTFEDISSALGTAASFSNGAAYGDLDNDGDLDLVVNNINTEAFILRNDVRHDSVSYINVKLNGGGGNKFGVGARISVYAGGKIHAREQQPTRGWLSSVDPLINIGVGANKKIDSLIVIWPTGKFQKLNNISVNNTLIFQESDATGMWSEPEPPSPMLTRAELFSFRHIENNFNTLNKQPLIPHASSNRGPKIAVADINGDKLDDVYVCGGQGQPGSVFVQTRAGKFVLVPQPAFEEDRRSEEIAAVLFDVDGDRDVDLMISSGGEEFLDKRTMLRLYLNNGRGTFTKTDKNLPKIYVNAPCIAPADVDNDGDMDVFVAGGVITGRYGFDSDSFILTNDGKGVFTGSPASFFQRKSVGEMLQAAVWIDLNNDQYPELITAGDWTTIQVWSNEKGVLKKNFNNGLDSIPPGWWTSLAAADMDNDGDYDIVAGNFGTNQRITNARLIVTDLDNNGSLEPLMSPLPPRDVLLKQVPALEKRFPTYFDYANATLDQIVTGKRQFERNVGTLTSMYIENLGNGKFKAHALPAEAQFFPVFAINLSDINDDGNKDILLAGNLTAVPAELWRADNGYGLALMGDGKGGFRALAPVESGFVITGEGRDIQSIVNFKKEPMYLVGRNNDSLVVFKKRRK